MNPDGRSVSVARDREKALEAGAPHIELAQIMARLAVDRAKRDREVLVRRRIDLERRARRRHWREVALWVGLLAMAVAIVFLVFAGGLPGLLGETPR